VAEKNPGEDKPILNEEDKPILNEEDKTSLDEEDNNKVTIHFFICYFA
jgi:hypothetical protein